MNKKLLREITNNFLHTILFVFFCIATMAIVGTGVGCILFLFKGLFMWSLLSLVVMVLSTLVVSALYTAKEYL